MTTVSSQFKLGLCIPQKCNRMSIKRLQSKFHNFFQPYCQILFNRAIVDIEKQLRGETKPECYFELDYVSELLDDLKYEKRNEMMAFMTFWVVYIFFISCISLYDLYLYSKDTSRVKQTQVLKQIKKSILNQKSSMKEKMLKRQLAKLAPNNLPSIDEYEESISVLSSSYDFNNESVHKVQKPAAEPQTKPLSLSKKSTKKKQKKPNVKSVRVQSKQGKHKPKKIDTMPFDSRN